jgi:hypothetical protein
MSDSLAVMEVTFVGAVFGSAGGAPLLSVAIGLLHFALSEARAGFARRALTSAYAPTTALLYFLAIFVLREHRLDADLASVYGFAQALLPPALLLVSFVSYPGSMRHHWYLSPLAVLCWIVQFVVGLIYVIPAK